MIGNPLLMKLTGGYRGVFMAGLCLLAAGCSRPEPGAEFNDPHEQVNRAVHAENVKLDSLFFGSEHPRKKPILPQPIAESLSNAASNLGLPSAVVNSVLQVRPGPALQNTVRFVINTTLGLGGFFDPATSMGIYADKADFGETLHVWGAPEGAFIVLPIAGPTTERDLAGALADLALDPLSVVGQPESYYLTTGRVAGKVGDRSTNADLIDELLYESADSYAQMRLIYLQYRHNQLGIEEDVVDPYEDPYGQ